MTVSSASPPLMLSSSSPEVQPLAERPRQILLITGMSGAGKTSALKALEDMGYEAIDHVPLSILGRLVASNEGDSSSSRGPLAIGVDVRTRDFGVESFLNEVKRLRADNTIDVKLVFLFCDDEELRRRYTETRHRHPLAVDRPLIDGITVERRMMAPLRSSADIAIDTTGLAPGGLKRILEGYFGQTVEAGLVVLATSFAFRSGLPREVDLVFDVRFLANPHYHPALRPMTGKDKEVVEFIISDHSFEPFFDALTKLLEPLLPRYAAEGKSYLTIAIGCTGGRHRSVFVAERLSEWLQGLGLPALIYHRDLDRSDKRQPDPESQG